jgi:hypothetical protein
MSVDGITTLYNLYSLYYVVERAWCFHTRWLYNVFATCMSVYIIATIYNLFNGVCYINVRVADCATWHSAVRTSNAITDLLTATPLNLFSLCTAGAQE